MGYQIYAAPNTFSAGVTYTWYRYNDDGSLDAAYPGKRADGTTWNVGVSGLAVDPDRYVYIIYSGVSTGGAGSIRHAKLDSANNIIWWGFNAQFYPYTVCVARDKSVAMGGSRSYVSGWDEYATLTQQDIDGQIVAIHDLYDRANDLDYDAVGNLYAGGRRDYYTTDELWSFSPDGALRWSTGCGGQIYGIALDKDSQYLYVGGVNFGSSNIKKYDASTGAEIVGGGWPFAYTTPGLTTRRLRMGKHNLFAINSAAELICISMEGNQVWKIEPDTATTLHDLALTPDDRVYVAGAGAPHGTSYNYGHLWAYNADTGEEIPGWGTAFSIVRPFTEVETDAGRVGAQSGEGGAWYSPPPASALYVGEITFE